LQADRVSICVTKPNSDGRVVSHCLSSKGTDNQGQLIKQLINEHAIPKGLVTLALSINNHKIHKLARPAVEAAEMKQSVLFMLKDRLEHGIEQSVVEVIDYPSGCQLDDQIMAIESSKKNIQQQVDIIAEAGLELDAIDISELLMGDILQSYPGIENGLALVLDHEDGASLFVYRGEYLYLVRQLSGITDLISCLPTESNMMMADVLLLEIQRTLDYYDAQMRQPPLAAVLLAPSFADITPLADYLNSNLATKVECLDINTLFNLAKPLSPGLQQDCLPACAAAFRQETK